MTRERAIEQLHPLIVPLLEEHLRQAEADPLLAGRVKLSETWRDDSTQRADWLKGRDTNGNVVDPAKIVTNARPGASWHGLSRWAKGPAGDWARVPASLAYHLALGDDGDEYPGSWEGYGRNKLDAKDVVAYTHLGEIGEALGLTWGGRWKSPVDFSHYELRVAPLSQVVAVLNIQGGDLAGVGGLRT